jgi:hypothetical protein
MKTTTSMRLRAIRFLSERYHHRERPNYLTELFLFGLIFVTAVWPMFSLAAAMTLIR